MARKDPDCLLFFNELQPACALKVSALPVSESICPGWKFGGTFLVAMIRHIFALIAYRGCKFVHLAIFIDCLIDL